MTLTYKLPSDLEVETSIGKVAIVNGFQRNFSIGFFSIKESVQFRIEEGKRVSLTTWIDDYVRPIQNFVSLLTRTPNALTGLTLYSDQCSKKRSRGVKEQIPLRVFFQRTFRTPDEERHIIPLVPFEIMRTDFGSYLERWMVVCSQLDEICTLFFGVEYNGSMFIHQKFLFYAQALECYHSRRMNNALLDSAEYKRRVKSVIDAAPEDMRKWIKEQFGFSGNRPSLADRLRELIYTEQDGFNYVELLAPIVGDVEVFLMKVKGHRNYFTHWDKNFKGKQVSNKSLFDMSQALFFLLQAILLGELGFNREFCINRVKSTGEYQYAIKRNKASIEL